MKINELYALTVVGLRKWPNSKTGEQHSSQELIVTKDPIKNPITPRRPKKGKKLFDGGKLKMSMNARWSPVADAAHAAVTESIKADYNPERVDAYDVADLVMDVAVKVAKESMKHKQRKHEKVYDDEPFKHTHEAYVEDAEEFVQAVIERLNDDAWRSLKEKVKDEYPELPSEVELRREQRQKKMEKE